MKNDNKDRDLVEYRIGKLTLLQLMAGLAVLGLVLAVAVRWWLG